MVAFAAQGARYRSDVRYQKESSHCSKLERRAYELLAQHGHFQGRASNFKFVLRNGVLVVRGRVPSFYLKRVLQTALAQLDDVLWIDNQVDVVSCEGLSSVRDM